MQYLSQDTNSDYPNLQSWAQLPLSVDKSLSVDPLINGTALIFFIENVSLKEERIFLNLFMSLTLKIIFCQVFKNLTLSTL